MNRGSAETSITVISDDDLERNRMLTVGGFSSSGPGLPKETISIGIADTIVETGKRFGGRSVFTSADEWSTPIARSPLNGTSLRVYEDV